jgi:hypothetical protein
MCLSFYGLAWAKVSDGHSCAPQPSWCLMCLCVPLVSKPEIQATHDMKSGSVRAVPSADDPRNQITPLEGGEQSVSLCGCAGIGRPVQAVEAALREGGNSTLTSFSCGMRSIEHPVTIPLQRMMGVQ